MSGAKSSEMDLEAEGRKRQKEEQTPSSMERPKQRKVRKRKMNRRKSRRILRRPPGSCFLQHPVHTRPFTQKSIAKARSHVGNRSRQT